MCGIFGFVGKAGRAAAIDTAAAIGALRRRGPDDEGTYVDLTDGSDASCVFAHTRLSIIDRSAAGRQPMSTPDGRYTLVYNGEIYNFRELRHDLERRGCRFSSETDTEVILWSYALDGQRCVETFRGIFSFAIWDSAEKSLFFARDRFGVKPFYYWNAGTEFAFASEVRALLATQFSQRRFSRRGLASYLMYGSVSDPFTVIDDVHALLPAHRGILKDGAVRIEPYWQLTAETAPISFAGAVGRVTPLLRDAVTSELISDAPLGVFLSGGVDSSAIVAYASAVTANLRTFTLTYDEPEYNEERFAAEVAARFHCDHQQVHLSSADAIAALGEIFASADQPSSDGVNTYFVARAARQAGLTVALSGLGGDEIFGGYDSFRRFRGMLRAGRLAAKLPSILTRSIGGSAFNGRSVRMKKLSDILAAGGSPGLTYSAIRAMFTSNQVAYLAPGLSQEIASELEFCCRAASGGGDDVGVHSQFELSRYLRHTLLRDTDVMSMANSLEVRVPLLDHRLVEAVVALPRSVKLRGGLNKPLMVASAPALPHDAIARKKMGFTLPLDRWLAGENAARLGEILESEWGGDAIVRADAVRRTWTQFQGGSPSVTFSRIWSLVTLKEWGIRHRVSI